MAGYRIGAGARTQIARILIKSAFDYGDRHAGNYQLLIETAMLDVASQPNRLGALPLRSMPGIWVYEIRSARNRVPRNARIRNAWHKLIYTRSADGVVEILAVVGLSYPADRAANEALLGR